GPVKNKPIQLPNGDILSGSSTDHDGWRVHFERSVDQGKTWTATEPVNDGKQIRAIQPSLLRYADGSIQALGRTRNSGIFEIWSRDEGRTWEPMGLTGLPNPSAGTDAVTLADGRQLLVYNHNPEYRGRSPLNVAVSRDGKTWEAALTLEDDPGQGYAYPAVIQSKDGLVHVFYTWRRLRMKHVVIDPRLLSTQPIVDGQWPSGD
ncbi:MAG: exo-alpha-sialidase, partial [Planctomycetales bacterium]|nr:exo-alpha-sialidase [Planctomycetales bacterium]